MSAKSKSAPEDSKAFLEAYLDVEEQSATKAFQKRSLRRLISRILDFKWLLSAGFALTLSGTAATLAEPRLFGYAIDEAIVPGDWSLLKRLAWVFLVVELVRVCSVIGFNYLFALLGQKVMQKLRVELFSHMQRLPVSVFDRIPAGKLVTRVTNDISSLGEMFTAGFVAIIGNFLVVLGIIGGLLVLNLELGLIAIATFPVLAAVSVYFSGKLRIAYRTSRSRLSALNAFLAENITGMRVVNLFNRQDRQFERFDRLNGWYTEAQVGTVKVFSLFQPAITLAAGASIGLVIYYGGVMAHEGSLQVGVLVTYFAYLMALFQPVREISDKWNIFLSGITSAERIFSILDWEPEQDVPEVTREALPIRGLRGEIEFRDVWFAYNGEDWVLKDFSIRIEPGMQVGIVGPTGAGKSTFISLLMRFYEPQKGTILIDGRDIREYDKRALRATIGLIQQDVFLFSGSIRENIQLWRESEAGAESADDEWLMKLSAARRLQALPGGLDAPLGERGTNLSMGERQVVAFARAYYSKPAIWILDEATANIDSNTERELGGLLRDAASDKTTLMIAHRLATIREADLILVLNKGCLVEQGDHESLMEHNGLYARLFRYQRSVAEVDFVST